MFNGKTKKDQENKLLLLQKNKNQIVNGTEPVGSEESKKMIQAWRTYSNLSYQQKAKIREEWDKYYLQVKESVMYQLFIAQKEAAKSNDWGRVRELGAQARDMRFEGVHETIDKPLTIDPWEFNFGWVRAFQDCEKKIKELYDLLDVPVAEEVKAIWE